MLANSTRKQYLREMGIEVWVLRHGRSPSAADAEPLEQQPAGAGTDPGPAVASAPEVAPSPPPEFHLCFVTYGQLSLIFSVPETATSLPPEMRQFADDIALALAIDAAPAIAALKWPMVKADDIDQSAPAARTAIDQRLADCGETRLVFGETAARWVTEAVGRLPAFEACMRDAASKRTLWRTLKQVWTS